MISSSLKICCKCLKNKNSCLSCDETFCMDLWHSTSVVLEMLGFVEHCAFWIFVNIWLMIWWYNLYSYKCQIYLSSRAFLSFYCRIVWFIGLHLGSTSWLIILGTMMKVKSTQSMVTDTCGMSSISPSSKTYSRSEILEKLQTYYTFVVVRNHLDRLVSGYRDKLINPNGNRMYEHGLGSKILRALRPTATETEIETGKGVTFPEYVAYVTNVHMNDQHFENYQDHYSPCIINFDYIVKLETAEVDGTYIINEHLSGYGADNLANKHSNRGGATMSKPLPEFENISRDMLHELASVYSRDLDMFAYSFVQQDSHLTATCGDDSNCCWFLVIASCNKILIL